MPPAATTEAGATAREQPAPAEVESYAERGMHLQLTGKHPKGCPCLCCADYRVLLAFNRRWLRQVEEYA